MIVYYSRFKNTEKMLKKLQVEIPAVSISEYDGKENFVLITPTYGIGEIPEEVEKFLAVHHVKMLGVISSGNMNWGARFAISGKLISEKYNVPWLYKYELTGNKNDIEKIRKVLFYYYEKEKLH